MSKLCKICHATAAEHARTCVYIRRDRVKAKYGLAVSGSNDTMAKVPRSMGEGGRVKATRRKPLYRVSPNLFAECNNPGAYLEMLNREGGGNTTKN